VKLSSRFALLFGALAALAAAALILLWGYLLDRAAAQRAMLRLRAEESLLAQFAEPLFDRPDELDRLVRTAGARLGLRVTAIEPGGRVLSDSELDTAGVARMENHARRPEIVEARLVGTGTSRRFSATLDRDFLYLAERVAEEGRTVGFIRLAIPVDDLAQEEAATVWAGRAAVVSACLLLFAVGAFASRRLAAPIHRVAEAARAVARGDLGREPPDEDDPDAAELSDAVRRMKGSLLASLEEVRAQQRLTAEVLDRLPSGLVVVGERGDITQANRAFGRMLDATEPAGRPLVDVVRDAEIYELFTRAREKGAEESMVWKRPGEETWEVHALALPGADRYRVVGIFRDVSMLSRTEAMRRRFVSDVSHELRTPVASISAAAETLQDISPGDEDAVRLVELIGRQARRMGELIDDLMDLSRIESGAIDLQFEEVALEPLAREVAADLAPRARPRGVRVEISAAPGLTVRADRRRLAQILRNLVDNAVKFSPDGEEVRISLERRDGRVVLSVADRGPGVPRSEREKIFQRFYQMDPSRSKARPGTGLGLAIVKHLVALHSATVRVGGEPGQGAVFSVEFPG
jgi:two-component system phosphate regulon sensor histidine kinase PhoR